MGNGLMHSAFEKSFMKAMLKGSKQAHCCKRGGNNKQTTPETQVTERRQNY